jgi:16S rRNA (cytosine1402-N4)-methyltransferase
MVNEPEHVPVLLNRVIEFLRQVLGEATKVAKKVADCTLGLGGYSEEILRAFTGPGVRVYGLDRDSRALEVARARLAGYSSRFEALHGNFGELEKTLGDFAPFDAFVFDLGVSNMQLTEAERGFSFQADGPLDMRMDADGEGRTAADVVNALPAEELARVFWLYGEERSSRQIARGIEERRKREGPLRTTGELVGLIRDVLPAPLQRKMGTHPARRVFQALRIYVNDELGELESGLASLRALSAPGAVVVVVSYHSLEDRIVKHTFRAWEKEGKLGKVLTKHPVLPDLEETEANYKARSAKLRVFRFSA